MPIERLHKKRLIVIQNINPMYYWQNIGLVQGHLDIPSCNLYLIELVGQRGRNSRNNTVAMRKNGHWKAR